MRPIFFVISLRQVFMATALILSLTLVATFVSRQGEIVPVSDPVEILPQDAQSFVNTLMRTRAVALLTGDTSTLTPFYDGKSRIAQWALEHEVRRTEYVQAWAQKRGLNLVESSNEIRLVKTQRRGNSFWITFVNGAQIGYVYQNDMDRVITRFGVGTRHVVEVAQKAGAWVVKREWYLDPLDEDTLVPDVSPAVTPTDSISSPWPPLLSFADEVADVVPVASWAPYNREAAIAYANTYCGAAPGCGNNRRYNPKYRDYTGVGGDCTNFVSQVLGDMSGGALPKTGAWRYKGQGWNSAGSRAWLQTDGFLSHLRYSGFAKFVARGTYPQLTKAGAKKIQGEISQIEPGDVVGFQEKGDVVHFAVVAAKDPRGVPLVNSHTADRYHVPWDLGWDQKTVYWLFHVYD